MTASTKARLPRQYRSPAVDYAATLQQAWRRHTAAREPDAPTFVSTFAGLGGSSLGYSMAGYRELLAVEWNEHAAGLLRRNLHGDVDVFHGDITDLDPDRLPLRRGDLDLLDGSPPCQGFSTSGQRRLDDPRNVLFWQFLRLIDAWAPKVFVAENVAGMVTGRMRLLFSEILTALKAAQPGYRVTARLLNAGYFGVPQARKRMIFIGVRADLQTEPTHPAPTSLPLTVRQALSGLADPGAYPPLNGRAAALAPYIEPGRDGADALTSRGGKRTYFNLGRLAWDRPSKTLLHTIRPGTSGLLHPSENRFLGIHELSRLQGIPDAYDWGDSTPIQVWERVGNSVPPPMAEAIGRTLRARVLTTAPPGGSR